MIKVLAAELRSKKGSGDEAGFLAASPLVGAKSHSTGTAAPPPNHPTTTKSLDQYKIPPATQAKRFAHVNSKTE